MHRTGPGQFHLGPAEPARFLQALLNLVAARSGRWSDGPAFGCALPQPSEASQLHH